MRGGMKNLQGNGDNCLHIHGYEIKYHVVKKVT